MKWLDFSYFKVSLLLRVNEQGKYFVANPIGVAFHPRVKAEFLAMGFKEESEQRLVSEITQALSKRMFSLKNINVVEVDKSDVIEEIIDNALPINEYIDAGDTIGANNERDSNERTGQGALAGVSAGETSELGVVGRTGTGAGVGGNPDQEGNGRVSVGRNDGAGSLAVGQVDIFDNRATTENGHVTDNANIDYVLDKTNGIGVGTRGIKLEENLSAIRLLKTLEKKGAQPTAEEKSVLAKFTGWGALKNVFNESSSSKQDKQALVELKSILTDNEIYWAKNGVLAQHFTSEDVISGIYSLLDHIGFSGGNIIEPTLGVGHFIGFMPESMRAKSTWYCAEIDPIPGSIAQHLYPSATILAGTPFQNAEFQYGKYNLAIGNPPYGDERITDINVVRASIDGFKIHNYIIAKSAMHLADDGLLAMVVTHRFLDSKDDEVRRFLADNFDLVTAIRLPNTAFKENAGTEVTTDIILLKKRTPDAAPGDLAWLSHDGIFEGANGVKIPMNQHFVNNPQLMLGVPSLTGSMYGRGDVFTLHPFADSGSIFEQINQVIAEHLGSIKDSAAKQSTGAALEGVLIENRTDISVGGFFMEADGRVFLRDHDTDENMNLVLVTPEMPWTEKTVLGEKRYARIKGMLTIRHKGYELIAAEKADSPSIEIIRDELNDLYDNFVSEFGYINDPANASLIDSDVKIEFGLEANYKSAVSIAKSKKRGSAVVSSIAEKADILKHRVFYPYKEILFAKNARDGYSISMSERGRLNIDFIVELTGQTREQVINELSQGETPLIFHDPALNAWIQEDEYLSGNVKRKLAEALLAKKSQTIQQESIKYDANVEALMKVQPLSVSAKNIFADIGQTWIPKEVYEQFLIELGVTSPKVVISNELGSVNVVGHKWFEACELSYDLVVDSDQATIIHLFESIANKRAIAVYDGTGEYRRVNHEKTSEANMAAKKMSLTFRDWLFADDARARSLEALYNETQNTTIERKHDGRHLRMVGATPTIIMQDTQKNAAWRMIQTNGTLLDHIVGAGKTFALVAGVMERRRLLLSKKPVIAVPKHLVSQWAKDFLLLYPGASILAASEKDFDRKNRRRLFANIAIGNYDAVIIGHSSLKFIPLSKEKESAYLRSELKELELAHASADMSGDRRSVRSIANKIAKRREKLIKLGRSKKDDVVTFEEMGFDYLVIDESHEFKNLEYASGINRVAGMGNPAGSQKAFDLYLKIKHLFDIDGGVTKATGTPISNSLVEMYSVMRYMNSEGLKERGLLAFDAWVKNYALIENKIEYTATQQLKERAVMSNFNNTPEMIQLYRVFADTVTMGDLKSSYAAQIRKYNAENGLSVSENYPVPKVVGGARSLNVEEPNALQKEYMDYLIERALKIEEGMRTKSFDPKIDNLLWVYCDAKKAALDIRIVDPRAGDDEFNKTSVAARNVMDKYLEWHDDKGTQLVFSDMSTPSKTAQKNAEGLIKWLLRALEIKEGSSIFNDLDGLTYEDKWVYLKNKLMLDLEHDIDDVKMEFIEAIIVKMDEEIGALITADTGFSVYDDLKKKLIAMGIPANEIQFIHDYDKAKDKKDLFDQVNRGDVRVLIGSTAKMGAGTNVQERLVWLHHLDASMHGRPSDIEQREGRIIRQKNKLFERDPEGFSVGITAYSTGKTFDTVSWQTLSRKAEMLEGFRKGLRTIEENGSDSASYLEFMAETTGNPIFKEKITLEREIAEIMTDQRRVRAQLSSAKYTVESASEKEAIFREKIALRHEAISLIGKNNTYSAFGRRFKRDLSVVKAEEMSLYEDEVTEHNNAMADYLKDRKKWEKKQKGERGHAPKKPDTPEYPSLESMRMSRSEEATFLTSISRYLSSESSRSFCKFYAGNLEYHITVHQHYDGVRLYDVQDEFGIILSNAFSKVRLTGLCAKIQESTLPELFSEEITKIKKHMETHAVDIIAAKQLLEKVSFNKEDELKQKQDRFGEINDIVMGIEAAEAERRRASGNRYVKNDTRRFGVKEQENEEKELTRMGMSA